ETGVLLQIDGVSDVAMQIDDSRHDPCAGEVQDFGCGGRLKVASRPDPSGAPVIHNHGLSGGRPPAGAIDQREILEYLDLAARRKYQERKSPGSACQACESWCHCGNRMLRLQYLDHVVADRAGHLFEPMGSARRNHDHVTLGQVVALTALDIRAQKLTGL